MTTIPLQVLAVLVLAVLPSTLIWVARDAIEFHDLVGRRVQTPWYSASWLAQPYTNLRLALLPAREYWTMNVNKSEQWRVREIAVGEVVFWTALKRIPADIPHQS